MLSAAWVEPSQVWSGADVAHAACGPNLGWLSILKRLLLGAYYKVEQKNSIIMLLNSTTGTRRIMEPDLSARLLSAYICSQTITYKQLVAMPELA
jgi:hypothetical protein